MPFPAPPLSFPTKDEMADYLEAYAKHFELPVQSGAKVDRLWREGNRYFVTAGDLRFEAEHVIVAMASYQRRRVPAFAKDLDPASCSCIRASTATPRSSRRGACSSSARATPEPRSPSRSRRTHPTWMSGRDTGYVPFRIDGPVARRFAVPFVLRFLFHRVLTIKTPVGRKVRPKILSQGGPLIRAKPADLEAAGVDRVARVAGVRDGMPLLEDGRVLDVKNVIWCTGFHPGFSWIDLPVMDETGEPKHEGGIVHGEPGLYFVGLHFLYAFSSTMIHGAARDAERIVGVIAARTRAAGAQ